MERLTIKHDFELRGLDGKQYKASEVVLKSTGMPAENDEIREVYNKLADFEDFMQEQGFESLEELDSYIQTIHSHYDEIKNKGTCGFCKHLDNKENQALKDRWQKLKKWIDNKMETSPDIEWLDFQEVWLEMQELEKE